MQSEEWIRKIHRFYLRKRVDLSSRFPVAPHGRIEGQFGRSRAVKGYEHVIVYLQLSDRIDFEKVKDFLKNHLWKWVKGNRDITESLDIFLFNDEEGKLIYNERSWTRFKGPKVPLLDFIDNTVKEKKSGDIRTLYQLFPKTSLTNKYFDGQHPNSKDFLIFITDMEGCEVDDNLKESLNKRENRTIWIKLEKEKEIIIETRNVPVLDNNSEEANIKIEASNNNIINENSLSKKYLGKSDFYLYLSKKDSWQNINMEKPIEISGNTLIISDCLWMPLLRDMGEIYFIPTNRILELKNKLLQLNIFQMKNNYPSTSIDGLYWQLTVSFDGNRVDSNGHNNYPPYWSQIVKAIEDCLKYKIKINIRGKKMNKKIDKINEKVWEAINSTINKFREHPYYFFTESDIVSYFYHRLYSTTHEQLTQDGKKIYLVHREYPTNFRYKKSELLKSSFNKPYSLDTKEGDRGNYDLAILDPNFVKNADSEEDIVNKNVRLLEIRTVNNKNFEISKELLFAIEFKYVINNSKNFVNEVKMDNKKLLFAKEFGGAKEVINLVFCNIEYHYIDDLKKEIQTANNDILSIFIQSYYDGKKKETSRPLMNKGCSRIK